MNMHFINEFSSASQLSEDDLANIKYHAENGNAEAQYHLALIYDFGNSVKRNPREAEKWYKKAAIAGRADAQYYLAKLYSTDNSGIRRDEKEAAKWFAEAAKQGYEEAVRIVN